MPVATHISKNTLEVTLNVSDGTGGIPVPFKANVTIAWSPAELTLTTIKQPAHDFSSNASGVVQWFRHDIPGGAGGEDFIVEFTCKTPGNHKVIGSAVNIDDGSTHAVMITLTDC